MALLQVIIALCLPSSHVGTMHDQLSNHTHILSHVKDEAFAARATLGLPALCKSPHMALLTLCTITPSLLALCALLHLVLLVLYATAPTLLMLRNLGVTSHV